MERLFHGVSRADVMALIGTDLQATWPADVFRRAADGQAASGAFGAGVSDACPVDVLLVVRLLDLSGRRP